MGRIKIIVKQGDITKLKDIDAIVNPANSFGTMGGGVAAAIKRAGGTLIESEAKKKSPIRIGNAVTTHAGYLGIKAVIHAPTMITAEGGTDLSKVRMAVKAALACAELNKFERIAMPGMGTGVGNLAGEDVAKAMVQETKAFKANHLAEIIIIDLNDEFVAAVMNEAEEK